MMKFYFELITKKEQAGLLCMSPTYYSEEEKRLSLLYDTIMYCNHCADMEGEKEFSLTVNALYNATRLSRRKIYEYIQELKSIGAITPINREEDEKGSPSIYAVKRMWRFKDLRINYKEQIEELKREKHEKDNMQKC